MSQYIDNSCHYAMIVLETISEVARLLPLSFVDLKGKAQ
jgi:hypothetical protein